MLIPALRFLVLQQYLKENEGSLTTILCVPGIYTFPGFSWCSAPHCARYTPTRTVRPPWRPCAASAFRSSVTVQDASGVAVVNCSVCPPTRGSLYFDIHREIIREMQTPGSSQMRDVGGRRSALSSAPRHQLFLANRST